MNTGNSKIVQLAKKIEAISGFCQPFAPEYVCMEKQGVTNMDLRMDKANETNTELDFAANKQIPKVMEEQILVALSHYKELRETCIRFVFTQKLKGSVMAARPVVGTLLGPKSKRKYDILISPVFKLPHSIEPIHQVSDEVLVGWIGHELGHILDYEGRSTLGVAKFGLLYWLSKTYIRKAERVADTFAVNRGMGSYILRTKEFILGHSGLSPRYKNKIKRLYLSPDDIVKLVNELEDKSKLRQEEMLNEEAEQLLQSSVNKP